MKRITLVALLIVNTLLATAMSADVKAEFEVKGFRADMTPDEFRSHLESTGHWWWDGKDSIIGCVNGAPESSAFIRCKAEDATPPSQLTVGGAPIWLVHYRLKDNGDAQIMFHAEEGSEWTLYRALHGKFGAPSNTEEVKRGDVTKEIRETWLDGLFAVRIFTNPKGTPSGFLFLKYFGSFAKADAGDF